MLKNLKWFMFCVIMLLIALPSWAQKKQNIKGMDIVIGNFWEDYDVNTWKPRNEVEELELEWRKKIQKEHGFTMKTKMIADWTPYRQIVTTSILAGKPAAHAIWMQPDWAMTLHRRGLLYPISDSKAVDWKTSTPVVGKQIPYNQEVQKLFTFNVMDGKKSVQKFFAFNPQGYGGSQHSAGVYWNKRLFREAGLDPNLPYDLQKSGDWTWAKFLEICKKLTRDRNNTGRIDTYAMPMDLSTEILDLVAFSNGAEYVGKDAAGKFFNATNKPEFIEALQFCRKLKDEGVMMPRPEGADWEWYFPAFHDGKVAMMLEPEWRADRLVRMTDDWGYVLFPKGPKAKAYRFPNDENVLIIPSTFKPADVDKILYAVSLWYMPVTDDWKAGMYRRYRDPRAVDETQALIRSPQYGAFRNHIMIPDLERGDIAWEMWWFDGDPAQLVEQVSQSWNAKINDANNIK